MINKKSEAQPLKYGSVYTPQPLADFVAHLLFAVAKLRKRKLTQVLDPACGEGALLDAIKRVEASVPVIGIDRDPEIERSVRQYDFIRDDFLLPSKVNGDLTWRYWQKKLKVISAIIANPPWSSDRVYSSEKLLSAGFSLAKGQYDCYVLFLELALQLLPVGGVYAFIIPDSLFSDQNTPLRQLILLQSEVKVVARLGEKIFPSVARAASIVVGMKKTPTPHTLTRCFRLNTEDRNSFLSGNLDLIRCFKQKSHLTPQMWFRRNGNFNIDVDTTKADRMLIDKLLSYTQNLQGLFSFGRGVEVSKAGDVVACRNCGIVRGFRQREIGDVSTCKECGQKTIIDNKSIQRIVFDTKELNTCEIIVGESLKRYRLEHPRYLRMDVPGVNYKHPSLYEGMKLLIRKTGLGIYAAIDTESFLTNQTVYILKPLVTMSQETLYFYLGIINSRVVYYFYTKVYGENEWKSHPYLTKDIIFSLPIPLMSTKVANDKKIAMLSKRLSLKYEREIDSQLEELVMDKFGLSFAEKLLVKKAMSELPDLGAINDMRL